MQMTDFGSAELYPPSANNWYPSQFTSIGNSFTGLNSNLNITSSPSHHQTINQLHHTPLDSTTVLQQHNSSPNNSTSPQTHQQSSQLTNLSNGLPSLTATQSNLSTQQLLSPAQQTAAAQQSRSNNTTSLNLSTSSNSTSTNSSNNTLPLYSSQLGTNSGNSVTAHPLHHPTAHQFNIPSHLTAAQHSTHNQFNPHSLTSHHPHQHTLNHLTAHHFLNVSNNFFPVHHHTGNTGSNAFNTSPSPSSPNNTSINSTTNAFNGLTFHRPDSASNTTGNAIAAMAAMSRASGLSPTESANQMNNNYDRMHHHSGYSGYSLIDHSSRTSGLDSFVGLRHMPTLTNLTSNCNSGAVGANGNSLNNLDDTNVNSMFITHHNQSLNPNLMAGHLNHLNSASNNLNQNGTSLVALHGSTHNNSVNSSSDSREDDMTTNCTIKQEEDEDKLMSNQFTDHPLSYNWIKKSHHNNSQAQAGNKR